MNPYDKHTEEYKGHRITIESHYDEDMGPPWKEHDGHGPVSEWTRREKLPGERVLCDDRGSKRFYDFQEAVKLAKADGWGVSGGKLPGESASQYAARAVDADYKHLKAWCDNEWFWSGYIAKVDGKETDACWGFDDAEYMLSEAIDIAKSTVDDMVLSAEQLEVAECYP